MSLFNKEIQALYWADRLNIWKNTQHTQAISELEEKINNVYSVMSSGTAIAEIIGDSQIIAVVGAYFGDEAKGKMTDSVSCLNEVMAIARVNSGENAGHTVYFNGEKLVFHILPSAVASDKQCYVGDLVVCDPICLMEKEVSQLINNNINYDNLAVGNFTVTTPYHKIMDLLKSRHNSSTGKGIAPIHSSMMWRSDIKLDDLFQTQEHLRAKIEKDIQHYNGFMAEKEFDESQIIERLENLRSDEKTKGKVPDHLYEFALAEDKVQFLIDLYQEGVVNNKAFPKRTDVDKELQDILESGGKIVLEGPQSYFLSNKVTQFHSFSTSADTTAAGIIAASGLNLSKYKTVVINVNKFPAASRVGIGDTPASFTAQDRFSREEIDDFNQISGACVDFDAIQKLYYDSVGENGILEPIKYEDKTGEYMICEAMAIASSLKFGEKGATTNKPRITGEFDTLLGRLVADKQGPYLVLSCMDRGDDCDNVGLTVGYVVHIPENKDFLCDEQGIYIESKNKKYRSGDIIRVGDNIPNHQVLLHCHSITKTLPGWKETPISSDKYNPKPSEILPENVCRVIAEIEHYTGFNVVAIGNGVNSEDLIYLRKIDQGQTDLFRSND